ncbi:hypothetical protein [Nocardioides convexus]|nr:hypothetical protein [Nocardioides convexus]
MNDCGPFSTSPVGLLEVWATPLMVNDWMHGVTNGVPHQRSV